VPWLDVLESKELPNRQRELRISSRSGPIESGRAEDVRSDLLSGDYITKKILVSKINSFL
jgi:hypothetical protein